MLHNFIIVFLENYILYSCSGKKKKEKKMTVGIKRHLTSLDTKILFGTFKKMNYSETVLQAGV